MKKIHILFFFITLNYAALAQSNLIWAKQMGSIGSDAGASIAIDNSGNVYTTGFFTNTADFDPGAGVYDLTSNGNEDIFISKLSPAGNLLWAVQIGSTDGDRGYSIATDAAGNVYATGAFIGTADFDPGAGVFNMTSAAGYGDMFVVKLNASGNLVFAKQFGGTGSISGYSIALDATGNIHTTGSFVQTIDFDPGPGTNNMTSMGIYDIFVCKIDGAGNFMWAKQMGGTTGFEVNISNSITIDAGGNVYTTGAYEDVTDFDPGAGVYTLDSTGFFICKLNSSGDLVWAKNIVSVNVTGTSITTDISGNVITTGSFAYTADFDLGPGTYDLTTSGMRDIFVLKTDPAGNLIWVKQMGSGTMGCYGYGVTTDAAGNIYTTGSFTDITDFNPGAGVYNLTASGMDDIFISKLDASGNFICADRIGGNASDYGYSIALDPSLNIYTTGAFSANVDFDPGPGTNNINSTGLEDIFVSGVTIDCSGSVGEKELSGENSISISPNPSQGKFYLRSENKLITSEIILSVYNVLGEKMSEFYAVPDELIDLSYLRSGVYFIKLNDTAKIVTGKIVIE